MQTNRKGFLELLERYMDGTCSSEEKQMMDYWYDLLNQEYDEKKASTFNNQLEAFLWAKIQHRTQSENTNEEQTNVKKGWQSDS